MKTPEERAKAIVTAITLNPGVALSIITGLCVEIEDLKNDNRNLINEVYADQPRISEIDIGELW